jgi:hypothetical protein
VVSASSATAAAIFAKSLKMLILIHPLYALFFERGPAFVAGRLLVASCIFRGGKT